MPLNYGNKRWVYVIHNTMKYVFRTNVPEAAGTALGHVAFNPLTANQLGAIYEANSPKPTRLSKERNATDGIDSSFVADATITTARTAGWKTARKPYRRRRVYTAAANKKLVTVKVDVGGVSYAWDMNRSQFTALTDDLAGLGITEVSFSDINSVVFGCSVPKPARVTKTVVTGGAAGSEEVNTYETFCDQSKEDSLPEGWTIAESRVDFGPSFGG